MNITQADRLEMHSGLQQALGDNVANILMEHLPPSGWSDVARTHDIDLIRTDFREFKTEIREQLIDMRADLRVMNARLDHHTKWLVGIALTYGATLLGTVVTMVVALTR